MWFGGVESDSVVDSGNGQRGVGMVHNNGGCGGAAVFDDDVQ